MGKVMAEPDAFGVHAADGAEEVEATTDACWQWPKAWRHSSGSLEKEIHLLPCRQVPEARGAPPKTGAEVVGTDPTPKPPVGRIPGRGGTLLESSTVGAIMGATGMRYNEVFPSESRKAVRSSLGSGGWGGTILMQVLGTFSRACCMTVANPKFIR